MFYCHYILCILCIIVIITIIIISSIIVPIIYIYITLLILLFTISLVKMMVMMMMVMMMMMMMVMIMMIIIIITIIIVILNYTRNCFVMVLHSIWSFLSGQRWNRHHGTPFKDHRRLCSGSGANEGHHFGGCQQTGLRYHRSHTTGVWICISRQPEFGCRLSL